MNPEYACSPDCPAILLVDDEIHALQSYEMQLLGEGLTNCVCCVNGKQALEVLHAQPVALMLLDLRMPEMSGEEVLAFAAHQYPHVPILIISAIDDIDTAVRCMKAGAFNYLLKPLEQTRLMTEVKRALEFRELRQENEALKASVLERRVRQPEAFSHIITNNEQMRALFQYIESIAPSSQPVLVTGETGAGKELIVQSIHDLSLRKGQFIAVNVAGLDDTTFSDTLFGHKRGAFTGANTQRDGLIERAAQGTLFLDEIGDLSMQSQVKLLRLLQEREYYPLGADMPKPTSARIIVATNCNLLELQENGTFRADLYYRLALHRIHVPPLRERKDDIPLLVEHFIGEAANELQKGHPALPKELFQLLSQYQFPGNVRELRGMAFDAMSYHQSGTLSLRVFKETMQQQNARKKPDEPVIERRPLASVFAALDRLPNFDEVENCLIEEALRRTDGNQSLTAALLGITRQTLYRRLRLQAQKEESLG